MIVTHYLDRGGVEEVILMYAKLLDPSKYDVLVACRVEGIVSAEIAALPAVRLKNFHATTKLGRLFSLWKIAREFKPDIVHNHFNWYGLLVGRIVGAPCVETVHNTYHWLPFMEKYTYALSVMFASAIVAVSDSVKKFSADFFPLMKRKRIHVIHNGIETSRFQSASAAGDLKKSLNIDDGSFVIGFIGRLEEQKGVTYLLQAVAALNTQFNNLRLVIVGDGALRRSLEEESRRLELTNVVFAGFQRDTRPYYSLFDAFVLPSLFEGLPVSVIEAMAARCPVVASDVGGVAEAVQPRETGFLVRPRSVGDLVDALRTLILDRQLARAMGEQGCTRAEREFSAATMVARTEELYHELLRHQLLRA